jgi:hypothetical protein
MILNGISIADPAKMNRRETLNEHYTVEMTKPGLPLGPFTSEQSKFIKFQREYPTVEGTKSTVEVTVPITPDVKKAVEEDIKLERYNDLHADVEKPILEADKNINDTMKAGAFFDPKSVNPPQFKETVRPTFRVVRDPASKLVNPDKFVKEFHYVYENLNGNKGYQARYYTNNPYKDDKGRIHLFDRPFTRNFA